MYRYWIAPQAYDEQGFTSFMIASPAQPFSAVPYIMEEAVKTQSPKLIVVEVRNAVARTDLDMDEDKDEEETEAQRTYYLSEVVSGMKPSLTKYMLIDELLVEDETNTRLTWNLPLLQYHDKELTITMDERVSRLNNDKHKYKSATQTDAYTAIELGKTPSDEDIVLSDEDKDLIDAVMEKADELGVNVLMISTPYSATKTRYSLQLEMEKYMAEQDYPYISFYDSTDEIGLEFGTDFYNSNHVNILGGEKMTTYLAELLAENYDLGASELTEAQKEEWDAAAQAWQENAAALKESCNAKIAAAEK